MAAANIKPKNCFKDFIHLPGLGKKSIRDGNNAIKKYGNAKPKAKNKKLNKKKYQVE